MMYGVGGDNLVKQHKTALKNYVKGNKRRQAFTAMLNIENLFWKFSRCGTDKINTLRLNWLTKDRKAAMHEVHIIQSQ